ncbi:CoA transferase [Pseudorhodoplanes sinuspersici]
MQPCCMNSCTGLLDLTHLLPGPLATLMLAEVGATVTKVERPGGDGLRQYEPRRGGVGVAYQL